MEWLYISENNNTDDHAVRILHEMKQQTNRVVRWFMPLEEFRSTSLLTNIEKFR